MHSILCSQWIELYEFGKWFGAIHPFWFIGVVSGITWKIIPAFSQICQLLLAGAPVKEQRANVTKLAKK